MHLSSAPSLADVQRVLWRAVRCAPLPEGADELFAVPEGANLEERLLLYRDMYWNRQVAALLELLPDTAEAMGVADFTAAVVKALAVNPSVHPALEQLPARLLPELSTQGLVPPRVLPRLRFEVAMLEALIAPPTPRRLHTLPNDATQLQAMRFGVIAGTQVVGAPTTTTLRLVSRPGEHATWWHVEANDAWLIDRLRRGATLEELCVRADGVEPEQAMNQVAQLLMMLLRENLLCEKGDVS